MSSSHAAIVVLYKQEKSEQIGIKGTLALAYGSTNQMKLFILAKKTTADRTMNELRIGWKTGATLTCYKQRNERHLSEIHARLIFLLVTGSLKDTPSR